MRTRPGPHPDAVHGKGRTSDSRGPVAGVLAGLDGDGRGRPVHCNRDRAVSAAAGWPRPSPAPAQASAAPARTGARARHVQCCPSRGAAGVKTRTRSKNNMAPEPGPRFRRPSAPRSARRLDGRAAGRHPACLGPRARAWGRPAHWACPPRFSSSSVHLVDITERLSVSFELPEAAGLWKGTRCHSGSACRTQLCIKWHVAL